MTIAVVPTGLWRDATAYTCITDRGRSALAWELLRRQPDYISEASTGADHGIVGAAPEVAVCRWGLHFPL